MITLRNNKKLLASGDIGVIPTDTIYGLVGSALNSKTVERIYKLRKRNSKKPFIILVSSIKDLALFEIELDPKTKNILENIWPGKVSVILPCLSDKLEHLHRGAKTLAFRIPDKKDLLAFLKKTGPLVAPSVNPEGAEPAKTIIEAKKYFGKNVDLYIDGGQLNSLPSTLVRIENGGIKVLRKGAVNLEI